MNRRLPLALLLVLACVPSSRGNQSHGTEFWAVHRYWGGTQFGIAVVNPSTTATATVQLADVGGVFGTATLPPLARHIFRLPPRTTPVFVVPLARTEPRASVRVTSDIPIAAYQGDTWDASAASDASLLAPRPVLGSEYLITGWVGLSSGEGYVMLHVAAIEPGTTAYSIVRPDGSIFESGTLAQWQTRQLVFGSFSAAGVPDPNGWRVITDMPSAVFGGNLPAYVGTSTCCADQMEEQLWPVSALGTRFALSPLRALPTGTGPRAVDAFFAIAAEDGTVVTTTPDVGSATLARGERLEIVTADPFILEASLPVQVSKFQISFHATSVLGVSTPAPDGGDPSMVTVPDVRGFALAASFTPIDGMGFNVLSIVSEVGGALELDGVPLTDPCDPVGMVDGRDWCHVLVEIGESAHRLTSTRPFWAEVSSNLLVSQGGFAFPVVQGAPPLGPPAFTRVDLDVKPGSCPNPLNFGRRGVIPAALVGLDATAAGEIDPATVEMEGVPALRCVLSDVTAPWAETPEACCGTPRADGLLDLVCHFDSPAVAEALCERAPQPMAGETIELHVTAVARDGSAVDVLDCVRVQQHDCGFTR